MPTPDPTPPSADGTLCPNCGAVRRGRFCHSCGQREEVLRQPVHHVLADSFVEMFGLDGRVWRSFGVLLGIPGKLTSEFLAGRRMRYLRPLRIYLTATLVFFVLLSMIDPVGRIQRSMDINVAPLDSVQTVASRLQALDTLHANRRTELDADLAKEAADAAEKRAEGRAQDASVAADSTREVRRLLAGYRIDSTRLEFERSWLSQLPSDQRIEPEKYARAAWLVIPDSTGREDINIDLWRGRPMQGGALARIQEASPGAERVAALSELFRASIRRLPTVMFFLLPLFAVLLKLLYVRRGWYYSEHLIFALHAHAVAFIGFSMIALLTLVSVSAAQAVTSYLMLALGVHFLLSMKRVYKQGWGRTLVKSALLAWSYSIVLSLGMVGALVLAAMFG